MDRPFDSPDFDGIPPLSAEVVAEALAREDITAAELLMLYFACAAIEPDEQEEFGGVPAQIADAMLEMAEEGDEDAMLAATALTALVDENSSHDAMVVGVAMFKSVATRPILQNVVTGKMEYEDAAAALTVINALGDGFLGGPFDLENMNDADLDELATMLGFSDTDLDQDGEINDR